MPGGDILLVIKRESGQWLVKLNREGNVAFKEPLFGRKLDFLSFHRLLPTSDGCVFVVGKKKGAATWMKCDLNGRVLSEKSYGTGKGAQDSGQSGLFDATALGNGEYVFCGASGVILGVQGAPSAKALLLRIDLDGNILQKAEFPAPVSLPGVGYQVATLSSGKVALLYPMRADGVEFLRIKILNSALREVCDRELDRSGEPFVSAYRIQAFAQGLVVAGSNQVNIGVIYLLNDEGQVVARNQYETGCIPGATWLKVWHSKALVVTQGSVAARPRVPEVKLMTFDITPPPVN
jgi:hypothetical protein